MCKILDNLLHVNQNLSDSSSTIEDKNVTVPRPPTPTTKASSKSERGQYTKLYKTFAASVPVKSPKES